MKYGDIQTPFDEPVAPTSSGARDGGGTSGGFDLGADTPKETPNSVSGLPTQVTTFDLGTGDPGANGQVDMPPVASPGTIQG
jgi:hypothetical protein